MEELKGIAGKAEGPEGSQVEEEEEEVCEGGIGNEKWGVGKRRKGRRRRTRVGGGPLSARAGVHGHVGIDLEHHVLVLVQEEDAEGRHLLGDTAGFGNTWHHPHCSHNALDGGMIGGLQRLKERKLREREKERMGLLRSTAFVSARTTKKMFFLSYHRSVRKTLF